MKLSRNLIIIAYSIYKQAKEKENLIEFQKAFAASWGRETAWSPKDWDFENPAGGHCRVTAVVAKELLGGNILKAVISKEPLFTHFWNEIDGKEVDFTKEQFEEDFVMPKNTIVTVEEAKSAERIKETYPILLKKVKENLKK